MQVICQEESHFLDFYGPPQTFRMESYSAVYQGKVTDLKDKVVFVGKANRSFSPGKTDYFPTPYTDTRSGKMAGVEIMATHLPICWKADLLRLQYRPFSYCCYLVWQSALCWRGFRGFWAWR